MTEYNDLNELREMIAASGNIVFFGGAGVSTESGIPDFRGQDGLYALKYKFPPETILSRSFFNENPEGFFEFYRDKMLYLDAEPNAAHRSLAELERSGKLRAVVTQNIDGLHQKAGSRNVLELHGSVHRNYCTKCGASYDVYAVLCGADVPRCRCGGVIKPDVVLYGESLDPRTLTEAVKAISEADMLIIGGTSLGVYPAAGLCEHYRGRKLVLINKTPTHMDRRANLIVRGRIGEVMGNIT